MGVDAAEVGEEEGVGYYGAVRWGDGVFKEDAGCEGVGGGGRDVKDVGGHGVSDDEVSGGWKEVSEGGDVVREDVYRIDQLVKGRREREVYITSRPRTVEEEGDNDNEV